MITSSIDETSLNAAPQPQNQWIGAGPVSLRKFPYPYHAALAICSDIDETKTTDEFLEIQRFLNTKNTTSMGAGIGLEIGNCFYFYDDEREFSYFTHEKRAQSVIIDLIQAGYIDCLHTYGDAAMNRGQILGALDELYRTNCLLEVWVNHYRAPGNFSRKFEYMFDVCQGDNPGSEVYHADVTLDYGIKFAWIGATTRLVGQSSTKSPFPLVTAFDAQYPLKSSISMAKEIRKGLLGNWGDTRYKLHRSNRLTQVTQLEDGRQVYEFMRYCNHPNTVSEGATSRGLAYVISSRALAHLKAVQGFMIVYTHLGKNSDCRQVIALETQAALRNLAREYQEGAIYVTTTAKLLNYYHTSQYLVWSYQTEEHLRIEIKYLDDPIFGRQTPTLKQLQGLTFYVPDSRLAEVYLQGVRVKAIQRNPADDSGRASVTIPFHPLSFPMP